MVVANSARQTYRALKRRAWEESHCVPPADAPDPRTTSVIAGSRLDFLDALDRLEAHRPDLVARLVLREVCELEYREIAAQLGIPEGTVKSRIHQARAGVRTVEVLEDRLVLAGRDADAVILHGDPGQAVAGGLAAHPHLRHRAGRVGGHEEDGQEETRPGQRVDRQRDDGQGERVRPSPAGPALGDEPHRQHPGRSDRASVSPIPRSSAEAGAD